MSSFQYNQVIDPLSVIPTAAGTTSLNNLSYPILCFTGTLTQTLVLPQASTFTAPGIRYEIYNESTGNLTIQFFGGAAFTDAAGIAYGTLAPNKSIVITLQTVASSAGTWAVQSAGTASPLTTKGDIYTYNTTNARQAVPGDYGRLVPDSQQATGWRAANYDNFQNGRPGKNYIQYADAENNATALQTDYLLVLQHLVLELLVIYLLVQQVRQLKEHFLFY